MKKLCIIGVGLIGGSIGIDARRKCLAGEVVGVVRRKESIAESIEMQAVDKATLDIAEGIKDADLIILAVPISEIIPTARKIKSKAVIADVASVKGRLVRQLEKIFGKNYIGTHPMAGSENRGVCSARQGIFKDAICVVTPTENTSLKALRMVSGFFRELDARVVRLEPALHDQLVALTSHIPHLISGSLVNLINKEPKAELCIGPGFKDMTRIAKSPPVLWQEICEWNKDEILAGLKKFSRELSAIRELIASSQWDGLVNKLKKAKDLRDKWK